MPNLPDNINSMTIKNLKYKENVLNITATHNDLSVEVTKNMPQFPICIKYVNSKQTPSQGKEKTISELGTYTF
ncbi:MAG: glycosyl hydrolase family 65 protein [Candidatus Hydrogenedens sp.]